MQNISKQPKQTRALLNCDQNPIMFSQIIRFLLLIQYNNIVVSTFNLINTLSYPKSAVPAQLLSNGTMQLVAFHLENKEGQHFMTLLNAIPQLFDAHCNVVNVAVIQAICA